MPVAKKPAMQPAKKARKEESDDSEEEESVLKKPAGATLKKPAGAAAAEESSDEDDDKGEESDGSEEVEDEEEEAPSVMKRPGMASSKLAKRPAAASGESESGEDEEEEEAPKPKKVSVDQLARQSANELRKKRRLLERLHKIKAVLTQKMRANSTAIRSIEKDLDGTEAEAQKHGRAAARVKNAKLKALKDRLEARKEKTRGSANKAIRMAKKRADTLKKAYESLQQKADFAENGVKKFQAALTAAEKECRDLAKQGFDVPPPGDKSAWAFSAPTAWHPKEVMAAKARYDAKQAMLKEKEKWEKVNAPAAAKKLLWRAAHEKLEAAKQKRKSVDEEPSKGSGGKTEGGEATGDEAEDGSHAKASAKGKAMKAMKAKKAMKAMKAASVMKSMKSMKVAKPMKAMKAMKA